MQNNPNNPVNFSSFKDGFSQSVTFLKRRFSSSDLAEDEKNRQEQQNQNQGQNVVAVSRPPSRPPPPIRRQTIDMSNDNVKNFSAPSSPAVRSTVSQSGSRANSTPFSYNPSRCKCLLVIDNSKTDWRRLFYGCKVLGDWDVRVEQADFRSINMISSNNQGCFVRLSENNAPMKLDFVLVRQRPRDRDENWRQVIIGLLYGGVPGLNSMQSVYSFADRAWVFSHLLLLRRRLGQEKLPLIDQTYALGFDQLSSSAPSVYPVVVKVGHAGNGVGKIKVQNPTDMLDLDSVLGLHDQYATVEPFVEAVREITVQKIGSNYRTLSLYLRRKNRNTYWKCSSIASPAEQVPTEERHKTWIDEISQLFGGLDISSLSALVGNDGREYIYKVRDCTFAINEESKEADLKHIVELVVQKMNKILSVQIALQQQKSNPFVPAPTNEPGKSDQLPRPDPAVLKKMSMVEPPTAAQQAPQFRRYSSNVESEFRPSPPPPRGAAPVPVKEEVADDTMGNLKKTFAGLFGDM